ncbi:MAG: Gfo/Idh/MocA family oxidoreductase, partial [Ferruginibacter sp.]
IDQALQLFGWPEKIFADTRIVRPYSNVDDYFEILLYYPGLRVRLKATYAAREATIGYIIHGLKGTLIKPKTNVQEEALQAGKPLTDVDWGVEPANESGLLHTEIDGEIIRKHIPSLHGNYMDFYDQLFDAIRNGQPVPVTAEDGLAVVRIIEAAYESSKSGRVVELKIKN